MESTGGKHRLETRHVPRKFKKRKTKPIVAGSTEEVLASEVASIIRAHDTSDRQEEDIIQPDGREKAFSQFDEVVVDVLQLTSAGDGIGLVDDCRHAVIVPFTVPGDKVLARIYRISATHSLADLVEVVEPSKARHDDLVKCKYFGKCSGCQIQMMRYEDQLEFKRNTITRAFQRSFGSESTAIPVVDSTHPSPLLYGYRTKITPHFEIPRSHSKEFQGQSPVEIGFLEKGRRRILDIEECAIATLPLNQALVEQRGIAKQKIYKRGATILLREALAADQDAGIGDSGKKCVIDPQEPVVEKVGRFQFEYPAGAFFQNNNVILCDFTGYAHTQLMTTLDTLRVAQTERFLVDAYCGSGLFSVTCSEGFKSVIGVEISPDSVKYAIRNAKMNGIENASFLTGSADKIFDVVNTPPDQTALIIDPPRKGCDKAFLDQLVKFNPRVIIYVSCNVHTQARDIGILLNEEQTEYKIAGIRGFDLFPQTHHVESITTLVRYQESSN